MSKVILTGYIVVPKSDVSAVVSELPNHTKLTLNEPGCIMFEVKSRMDNSYIFDVHEEFIDEASFEFHQSRIKDTRWEKVTINVKRHYEVKR